MSFVRVCFFLYLFSVDGYCLSHMFLVRAMSLQPTLSTNTTACTPQCGQYGRQSMEIPLVISRRLVSDAGQEEVLKSVT